MAKDKFFSIIAHDLKSPFNSLMGLSEMLVLHSETMNQAEVLNYSKMVHQSTGKLFALVENLLQWSRTQMGTTDYKPEKLDLNILTGNVVNLLRLSAQEKDIVIALKMENDLLSYADANIYSTVLRNLVGNAIKFSRVGSIIHVAGKKRSDGMIEVEVSDSGVGMNSEQLEKVFKIESAQSTVGTFNEKGTGLGLILSKEFVELNKGTIEIVSRIGEGTTVRFTVPSISIAAN
jgi:signal transduction histidine kinase